MTTLPNIRTPDGTVIARCPRTGAVASGRSLDDAVINLRSLTDQRQAGVTLPRQYPSFFRCFDKGLPRQIHGGRVLQGHQASSARGMACSATALRPFVDQDVDGLQDVGHLVDDAGLARQDHRDCHIEPQARHDAGSKDYQRGVGRVVA